MVFHLSLSDSKSPQVSRILLCFLILTMLRFEWSWFFLWIPIPPVLWELFQASQQQLLSLLPLCYIVCFSSLARSKYLSIILLSLIFTLCMIIIIIIIIINKLLTPCGYFLKGSFSIKSVQPGLSLMSKYSSWPQQHCDLNGLDSSSDFQFLQSSFQAFWRLFQGHQQVVSLSLSCSTTFSAL